MLQQIQMLSTRHAPHRRMLPTKDKIAVVAGQVVGSSAPCRKSTCLFEIEIPGPALQEIEAAPVAAALLMVGAECVRSCQCPMKIVLFAFS